MSSHVIFICSFAVSSITFAASSRTQESTVYKVFVHVWRKCAEAIDHNAIIYRDELYRADKGQGVCSCASTILNRDTLLQTHSVLLFFATS
ncbi:hypothetical protein LIPSTDRAFT_239279 [Lipomyces starkeyi NRRL Y-11557]|uniref:Secreted protein n=1 Tax=Lipomyces starkeyi NRRL Y-11557 TaxID=675824 RepID=A0A1E3QDG4_LIPST|nr:hypothetical protein LIPSTDRAFT_239279 [Lipomyces starkeyi NRRL Y-11557]